MHAAEELGYLHKHLKPSTAHVLRTTLQDTRWKTRMHAAYALLRFNRQDMDASRVLCEALLDEAEAPTQGWEFREVHQTMVHQLKLVEALPILRAMQARVGLSQRQSRALSAAVAALQGTEAAKDPK